MPDKETTSFMRSLCMGQIEQDVLFPFPSLPWQRTRKKHSMKLPVQSTICSPQR